MNVSPPERAASPVRQRAFVARRFWRWSERDDHQAVFVVAGLAAGTGLLFGLLPRRLDVFHTYAHGVGFMAPTCGLTRAGLHLLGGDLTGAWSYNPAIFLVAPFVAALIVRFAAGVVAGRWLTVQVRTGAVFRLVVAALLIVLWLNQQAHFALLAA